MKWNKKIQSIANKFCERLRGQFIDDDDQLIDKQMSSNFYFSLPVHDYSIGAWKTTNDTHMNVIIYVWLI